MDIEHAGVYPNDCPDVAPDEDAGHLLGTSGDCEGAGRKGGTGTWWPCGASFLLPPGISKAFADIHQ